MKLKFDLRLFDAGGAEAAQASADAQTEGLDTGSEQGAEETAQSTADRQAEYEAMLEKYADLDSKRMEQAAKDQQRVTRQLEEQLSALQNAVAPLYQSQGIAAGDVEALSQAIQNDDSYWERGAEAAGMTVDQYKQMQMAIAENAQLRRTLQAQQQEEAPNRQIAAWQAEAETVKQEYPDFDLMQEIQNPLFASLISSKNQATRLSLKAAYEACHVEEIRQMAARQAAKTAETNTVQSIRAGAHRPKEAGSGTESAVTPGKIDITKLTREQRRDANATPGAGERITFQEGMKL